MNPAALRAQYPVLDSAAYLNAGTCGPLPAAALKASGVASLAASKYGRGREYFEELGNVREQLRAAYAAMVGGGPEEVALTTGTSEGIARVVVGLGLCSGDEVLTADDEHPGLYGPLAAAREQLGIEVRAVPLAEIADAVSSRTRLVACSHVSWITGALAPPALASLPGDVPVLLDGAQGVGAVDVDVAELGCAFYAGSGQKWLCGPVGTGLLWVAPAWRERLTVASPTYVNLSEPGDGLRAAPWPDARALDAHALSYETMVAALNAHDVLAVVGWSDVRRRAAGLAAALAERLQSTGRTVAPRGGSTLVTWEQPNPEAAVARLAREGVIVRSLPGTSYLRASVGAWNDESDLERLLAEL
jgi:L-cysteine/cystine lyase